MAPKLSHKSNSGLDRENLILQIRERNHIDLAAAMVRAQYSTSIDDHAMAHFYFFGAL